MKGCHPEAQPKDLGNEGEILHYAALSLRDTLRCVQNDRGEWTAYAVPESFAPLDDGLREASPLSL
jgi:hypothetical protein